MGEFSRLNELLAEHDMIPPGSTVLCAVSGGADSVYLLHRLHLLRGLLDFRLVAAHYDHGLRGEESRRDAGFVRDFVARYCGAMHCVCRDGTEKVLPPVELEMGRGDVAARARAMGTGLEETARAMRYAFLEETADRVGAQRIATAHTADDDLETFLLHLLRGTGLRGLTGIPPRRGRLIRPLLTTTRAEVEEYLRRYGLPHVEDSSNGTDDFLRNRLRHRVIPELEELAPGVSGRFPATAARLRRDDGLLEELAGPLWRQARREGEDLVVPAAVLGEAPLPLSVRAARQLLGTLRPGAGGVTAAHLEAVAALCRGNDPSARVSLPGGLAAWREYDRLVLGPDRPLSRVEEQTAQPPCALTLGGGWTLRCRWGKAPETEKNDGFFCFSRDKLEGALQVRSRRTGDELALPGRPRRTLKRLLIDLRVPRRKREAIPLLADGAGVLLAAGIGPDSRRLAREGEEALWARFERGPGADDTHREKASDGHA